MPTAALRQITAKQDNQALRARLEAEAARVQISYKASVIDFMVMEGIQDFSELDYATRKSFEAYLEGQSGMKHIRHHLLAFDKLKQHALSQEFHILEDGKVARPRYENGILYLPYHPDPKVSAMFRNSTRKNEHVWDFSRNAPERMKRQVFDILHYELENSTSPEGRRVHLLGCGTCMTFVRSSGSRISKPWNCCRYRRSVKSPATGSRKASALETSTSAEERCSCKRRKSTGTPMYGIWSGSTYSQSGWIPQTLC